MGTCVGLILLAWNVVRFWSVPAAIAMSVVAAVIPPAAAVVANWGRGGLRPRATRRCVGDLLDERGGGDGGRAGEVVHVADVVELVELAGPVVAHDQDVGLVLDDVVALLLEALLEEDGVHGLERRDDLQALPLGEDRRAALLALVEGVGGDPDDEAVAEGGGALDDAQVADMEDVEGAERDDRLAHGRTSCHAACPARPACQGRRIGWRDGPDDRYATRRARRAHRGGRHVLPQRVRVRQLGLAHPGDPALTRPEPRTPRSAAARRLRRRPPRAAVVGPAGAALRRATGGARPQPTVEGVGLLLVAVGPVVLGSLPVTAAGLFLIGFGSGTWDVVDERPGRSCRATAGSVGDAAVPRIVQPGHGRGRRRWVRSRPTSVSESAGTSVPSPCSTPILGALSVRRFLAVDTPADVARCRPGAAGLGRAAHARHRGDGAGDGAHRGCRQRLARGRDGRRVRRPRLARRGGVRAVRRRDDDGPGHRDRAARRPGQAARALGEHGGRSSGHRPRRARTDGVAGRRGHRLVGRGRLARVPRRHERRGRRPGTRCRSGQRRVSTIGYTAFLVGPPLLGLLGSHFGVLNALLVVSIVLVPSALAVPAARKPAEVRS